ncbi:hypothetical protein BD410DRAFT_847095, partial [Rickenella mellea]
MASFSPAPIATEPTPKDMLKPLLVRAKPNFSAIPLETAPQEVKAGWALRVSGILDEVDEVMMALQGKPGLGKAKAQVETWKTTLHDFKLSNGLAEEDVEDLFWSDEDDDMGDIPSEPAVPARVEDSFPDNLGAGVQASSIPGLSTLHQAISDPDSDNFLPSSRDVHDAGPTAPHETISDSAGDHVHVTQSSSRDAHDAGATTLSQTISDSDRTDTNTTLRPSHDAQVTFEEGQNPPSPRAERDETASEGLSLFPVHDVDLQTASPMEDDESETSRSESSEPEVSSRKRPREDDADDAPADLPTTSSGKVQPQVFIARADHSRPTPTPPITVQGPKAKRLKSDTPVIKEDTGNGTVETGDDGSADWTYRDKEGKLVTKHYDPVRGESCRRCTMQRLNCLVILSEKTTSIACMACTRGKSGCSFVTDRKEAKGLASGKSTGNVHAAKKTNAKKTE